jgi:hypothetical protein
MRCIKGRRLGKGEELAVIDGGEFDPGHLQMLRSPASNFITLSQGFREGAKGDERGVRGVFKEGGGVERGLGYGWGEAMDGAEASGAGRTLSRGGRRVWRVGPTCQWEREERGLIRLKRIYNF